MVGFYIILFTMVGFVVAKLIKRNAIVISIIVAVSIFWGFHLEAIWGLASLAEMLVGYAVQRMYFSSKK